MKDILQEIVAHKRVELEAAKKATSLGTLAMRLEAELCRDAGGLQIPRNTPEGIPRNNPEGIPRNTPEGSPRNTPEGIPRNTSEGIPRNDAGAGRVSMRESLAGSQTGIIAEFKRRSPSKDWINRGARAEIIPAGYEAAGAAALSILTDERFFGGGLDDVRSARPLVGLPILRKDFIIDEYQLYQARLAGANAVLLIAACLDKACCTALAAKAHELGLETLLEVHGEPELEYVGDNIDMVGVNNRNLGTFHTDVANSFRLAEKLPKDMLLVSESGISKPETVLQLREAGFRGFLIGETFMKTPDPAVALGDFIRALQR